MVAEPSVGEVGVVGVVVDVAGEEGFVKGVDHRGRWVS